MNKKNPLIFILFIIICIQVYGIFKVEINEEKITYYDNSLALYLETNDEKVVDSSLEEVMVKVKLDTDTFEKPEMVSVDATNEEVEAYKKEVRRRGKEFFSKINAEKTKSIIINAEYSKYTSLYSPIIEYTFSVDEFKEHATEILSKTSSNKNVSSVGVYGYDTKSSNNMYLDLSLSLLEAEDVVISGAYTGDGVNVGLLEPAIVDTTYDALANTTITIRNEWYYNEQTNSHTTAMAAIIAGTGGVAPDAHIFSVELFTSPTGEIDWLLENNVDVVNCSYGDGEYGQYTDDAAYYDYITYTYDLLFVIATGNNLDGDRTVDSPATAYNVLSVGASCELSVYNDSSHVNAPGLAAKPNVLAPGYMIMLPGSFVSGTGTSASAAMVTGCLALLMEEHPALKVMPELAIACATSSAIPIQNDRSDMELNGFKDISGAGMFNYFQFDSDYVNARRNLQVTTSAAESIIHEETERMYEGELLSVGICYSAIATGDKDETWFPHFGVYVYGPQQPAYLYAITDYESTVKCLQFRIPEDGRYTIQIFQLSNFSYVNTHDYYIGFSYHITDKY